jgi:hypothetical protein
MKRKGNRKRSRKITRDKILLDTSIQIEKIKSESVKAYLNKLSTTSDLFSNYYVLYEFKTGLILSAIKFYGRVQLYDNPKEAIFSWSNSFRPRDLKYKEIIEGVMFDLNDSIPTKDKVAFLAQIETAIFHLITQFEVDLKGIIGDFGSEPLVKQEILFKDTYAEYVVLYEKEKNIKLQNFWLKHVTELKLLLANKKKLDTHSYLSKVYEKLEEISTDSKRADMPSVARTLGDVVISVDVTRNIKILSTDSSFDILCPLLNKTNVRLPKVD